MGSASNEDGMSGEQAAAWEILERAAGNDDVGLVEHLDDLCESAGFHVWELATENDIGGVAFEMDALMVALLADASDVLDWLVMRCMDRVENPGEPEAMKRLEKFTIRCLVQVGLPNGQANINGLAASAAETILGWMRAASSADAFDEFRLGLESKLSPDAMAIFDQVAGRWRAKEEAAEMRAAVVAEEDSAQQGRASKAL